jgi:pyruvate dehydrogenase E1 component alpha subunit
MSSLARIRLVRRLVSASEFNQLSSILLPQIGIEKQTLTQRLFFQPLRTGIQQVRSIQWSADADPAQPFTVKLPEDSFRSFNCEIPELDVEVTKADLLTMYKQMQTMRRMEMAADALYKAKLIRGFCHLAIGQVSRHYSYYSIRVGEYWPRF